MGNYEAPQRSVGSALPECAVISRRQRAGQLAKTALKEARWVLPATALGAAAGFGVWNGAKGSDYEVGPATVNSKFTWGTDATLRYGADIVRADIDTPLNTGITIEIREVDSERIGSVDSLLAETGVTGDPKALLERVTEEAATDAATAAALGGLAIGGAMVLARRRPHGLQKRAAAMSTAGLLSLGAVGGVPSLELHGYDWQKVGPVFDGNSYDAFSVTGPTSSQVVDRLQKNERYYNKISDTVRTALEPIAKEDKAAGRRGMYVDSDWHCNFGMARVAETTIKTLGIDTVVSLGDVVPSGSSYETPCIDVYAQRTKSAKNRIVAPGNHDSAETVGYMEKRGFTVLRGKTIKMNGLTIYGDSDPMRTPFAAGQELRNSKETAGQFSDRIAQDVERTAPDILFIHNPDYVYSAAQYAKLTVNGHKHMHDGPTQVDDDSVRLTTGTVGGASENSWTLTGRLGTAAEQTIVYYENRAGKNVVTGLRTIIIEPNATVTISPVYTIASLSTEENDGAAQPGSSIPSLAPLRPVD